MESLYQQIRIAIHSIWKRRWLALAVAWGVALLGWLAVSGITNTYESRASVFVQMQTMLHFDLRRFVTWMMAAMLLVIFLEEHYCPSKKVPQQDQPATKQ